ncbi:elongator complex protein 2 [Lingula anatina]|uniref:Elongator complex protein 2 n=1 Tax=Lingula anatina TaxID=7574 RepID=A0A1S3J4F9_LINAN|nr:elongator complex protein 2 [Lingula anatina]|eukprot:XP_013405163.1 elongator complex protein 2 [Lingula anatina]
MAAIHVCFSSCGCNRTAHCVDWGRNGLVCYGACRAVALYQPQQSEGPGGIVANLVAHEDRVNCVKWISMQDGGDETELVSGSSDRTAIVWQGTGTKVRNAD